MCVDVPAVAPLKFILVEPGSDNVALNILNLHNEESPPKLPKVPCIP
jgi:hypothetical protein